MDGRHSAMVAVEPAVGNPYDLVMLIDPAAMTIDLPRWKHLSEHQQQHAREWAGAIADTIIRDQTGRN